MKYLKTGTATINLKSKFPGISCQKTLSKGYLNKPNTSFFNYTTDITVLLILKHVPQTSRC